MRKQKYDFTKDINSLAFEYGFCSILFIDEFGKIFHANDTACDKSGYSFQKLTEMHIWDLDNYAIKSYEEYLEIFTSPPLNSVRSFCLKQDGKSNPIQISAKKFVQDEKEFIILYITDDSINYKMEENKEIYNNMLSTTEVSIFVVDVVTNKILFANEYAYEESGYTKEELASISLLDILRDYKEKDKYYNLAQKLTQSEEKKSFQLFITKSRQEIPVEVNCTIQNTHNNSYKICIFYNLTSQFEYEYSLDESNKKLEQSNVHLLDKVELQNRQLNKTNERLSLALSSSSDGFWDWDIETNKIYLSPRWKEILGYTDDELDNSFETWKGLVDSADKKVSWQLFNDFIKNKESKITLHFDMLHKKGRLIPIECKIRKLMDKNGNPQRIIGTYSDVTQLLEIKKQSQHISRELDENRKILDGIFEAAQIGLIYSKDRVVQKVNKYTLEQLGYEHAYELIGQSSRVFYTSDADYEKFGKESYNVLAQGDLKNVIYPIRKKDGSSILCDISASPIDKNRPADLSKGIILVIKEATKK